jgi:hypothetical protein
MIFLTIVALVVPLVIAGLVVWIALQHAPVGYEDRGGFHQMVSGSGLHPKSDGGPSDAADGEHVPEEKVQYGAC